METLGDVMKVETITRVEIDGWFWETDEKIMKHRVEIEGSHPIELETPGVAWAILQAVSVVCDGVPIDVAAFDRPEDDDGTDPRLARLGAFPSDLVVSVDGVPEPDYWCKVGAMLCNCWGLALTAVRWSQQA